MISKEDKNKLDQLLKIREDNGQFYLSTESFADEVVVSQLVQSYSIPELIDYHNYRVEEYKRIKGT